jgi:hypothetical protein
MNIKELVDAVSTETQLPAAQVRKVSLAILEKFAGLIHSQTNFTSPVITLTAAISPAKPATGDKPAHPERKFARMAIRSKKSEAASAD